MMCVGLGGSAGLTWFYGQYTLIHLEKLGDVVNVIIVVRYHINWRRGRGNEVSRMRAEDKF